MGSFRNFFANDVVAQFYAFIADENAGTGNKFAHFVLALTAERAIKKLS